MIRLHYVFMRNFLSVGQARVDLEKPGPVLVMGENLDSTSSGSNGSGKSTIFEGVVWGLFGQTLRGIPQRDVVRREPNTTGCQVNVVFSQGDNKYAVVRYQDDPTEKNSLHIYLVEPGPDETMTELPVKNKAEVQKLIEDLLGVDFKLFAQSTILGQDSLTFSTATDAEKKRILEDIAGIAVYDQYLAKAKEHLAGMVAARGKTHHEVEMIDSQIIGLQQSIQGSLRDAELFEDRKKTSCDRLSAEVGICLANVQELMGINAKIEEVGDSTSKQATKLACQDDEIRGQISDTNRAIGSAKSRKLAAQAQHTALEEVINRADGRTCMTCGKAYTEEENDKYVAKQQASMDHYLSEIKKEADEVERQEVWLKSWENDLSACRKEAQLIQEAGAELIALKARAGAFFGSESRLATKQQELREELESENWSATRAEKDQVQVGLLEATRNDRMGTIALLDVSIERHEFWVTGFGKKGVRGYALDHAAAFLNTKAAKYSQYLTDGEIDIVFSTQRQLQDGTMTEDFQVHGVNQNGADVYSGNSVGERQKIDMCVALALQDFIKSRTGSGFNLFVCDEAAANLDEEGSERMLELMSDMCRDGKRSVWYVTHDPRMQDQFQAKLLVQKKDGKTTVKEIA